MEWIEIIITIDSINVWGNEYPYLKSVESIYDTTNPSYTKEILISYESHAGKILAEHYATRVQTERLLALGDLSVLGETPETCVAYCRDRGEEFHAPMPWGDRWQLAREAYDRFWANYSYLLMDGIWHVSDGGPWDPVESQE